MISLAVFFMGIGTNLHAVANELYYKGGYMEILRPQGEYIGLALAGVGYLIAVFTLSGKREDA